MNMALRAPAAQQIGCLTARLLGWLTEDAAPLWALRGVDLAHGGFFEAVGPAGAAPGPLRRARVAPRQIYAFARAARLGWAGDAPALAEHGLAAMRQQFLRADGLYRTVASVTGVGGDERPYLYDQAFMLLGLAEAWLCLGQRRDILQAAQSLRLTLCTRLRHRSGGFATGLSGPPALLANPHMHLLEAALAWWQATRGGEWLEIADEIGELAIARMIDPATGSLAEAFDADWRRDTGLAGRVVEPGHQFEWAWLLLAWQPEEPRVQAAARRLIDNCLARGVRDGVAINALLDDFSVHDAQARLWPQAEWVKACARACELFGPEPYEAALLQGVKSLSLYLQTPIAGLWHDTRPVGSQPPPALAAASSFYHIVAAIGELERIYRSGRDASPVRHPG